MAVVRLSGHQKVWVVSHEPRDIGSAQFDRQAQECQLLVFGHRELGRHGMRVRCVSATAFNRRPEKAYSGINPAQPGSIFPQVKNSPGPTKQALKTRNPTSWVLAHLVGFEVSKWTTGAVYTEISGAELGRLPPLL